MALPLMVPSRTGDLQRPQSPQDRHTGHEGPGLVARLGFLPERGRAPPCSLCSPFPVEPSRQQAQEISRAHGSLTRSHPKTQRVTWSLDRRLRCRVGPSSTLVTFFFFFWKRLYYFHLVQGLEDGSIVVNKLPLGCKEKLPGGRSDPKGALHKPLGSRGS